MNSYQTIPATTEQPLPNPPCTGQWLRLPCGGLQPADEATATAAGLKAAEPEPEPEPVQSLGFVSTHSEA